MVGTVDELACPTIFGELRALLGLDGEGSAVDELAGDDEFSAVQ